MKKIFTLLYAILIGLSLNAQLNTGEILFVGFNGDASDEFAFVTLVDIPANTNIYFTDNEWNGNNGFNDLNEGEITWTHTAIVPAGTVVVISGNSGGAASTTLGTVSGNNLNLGTSNEDLFASSVAPATSGMVAANMLAGISSDLQSNLANSGLTVGTNFIDFNNDHDGFAYTGSRSSESAFADYTALIMNTANWQDETSNGSNAVSNMPGNFTLAPPPTAPIIILGSTSMSGFTYEFGSAVSPVQTNTLEWANLTGNVSSLNTVDNFEFSLDKSLINNLFPEVDVDAEIIKYLLSSVK